MNLKEAISKINSFKRTRKYRHYCAAGTKKIQIDFYSENRFEICPHFKTKKWKHCRYHCDGSIYGFLSYTETDDHFNAGLEAALGVLREYTNYARRTT